MLQKKKRAGKKERKMRGQSYESIDAYSLLVGCMQAMAKYGLAHQDRITVAGQILDLLFDRGQVDFFLYENLMSAVVKYDREHNEYGGRTLH